MDKFYINGTYLGTLSGANSQWSTVTFSAPPGTLKPGANQFQVQVDTGGTGCWSAQVDFASVELDFNIALLEVHALQDVDLQKTRLGPFYGDTIWKAVFDAAGKATPPGANNQQPNYPIADFFEEPNASFTYEYVVGQWPGKSTPPWEPTVEYTWKLTGPTSTSDSGKLKGWSKSFDIPTPIQVGKYKLTVKTVISREGHPKLTKTENREHVLYVTWKAPLMEPATVDKWLDVAVEWATGAKTDLEVASKTVEGEYKNRQGWLYANVVGTTAETMIEATGPGQKGSCYSFRDVWQRMTHLLGVPTNTADYKPPGFKFATTTKPALENQWANLINATTAKGDRWIFDRHAYGQYNGAYYDPTFGASAISSMESGPYCRSPTRPPTPGPALRRHRPTTSCSSTSAAPKTMTGIGPCTSTPPGPRVPSLPLRWPPRARRRSTVARATMATMPMAMACSSTSRWTWASRRVRREPTS
ncbi:hypothetical protein ACN28S_18770 [Cystobacter fuscus]